MVAAFPSRTAFNVEALKGKTIAIYLPDLSGGGAERLHLNMVERFQKAGMIPRLVLDRRYGALVDAVPPGVAVDTLQVSRPLKAIPKLREYLRSQKPDIFLANTEHANVVAIWAHALVSGHKTKLVVTQHNAVSHQAKRKGLQWRLLPSLYRLFLRRADAIIAVSQGVGNEMVAHYGAPAGRLHVIHNGVVNDVLPPLHTGREQGLVLAVGRMVAQKDYPSLLRAFAQVKRPAKLRILGEGPARPALEALAESLGIADRVEMPGFVSDPGAHMASANVVVLSSRFEGFGNVLAEALAHGTSCVSTDCCYGPSEILGDGQYGKLVPVGDASAMAAAIDALLEAPLDPEALRRQAEAFTIGRCADRYLALFNELLETESPRPAAQESSLWA